MPGVKGQRHPVRKRTFRQQMWQTMRIKRAFTVPDLLITVPGAIKSNAQKMVYRLEGHGVIRKAGPSGSGRPGVFQVYRLVCNTGPLPPDICPNCGRKLTGPGCLRKKDAHRENES